MENFEKLYTVDQVAEMLSVTPRTVRNYLCMGTLKGRKIGGQWRFTADDIQSMFDKESVKKDMRNDTGRDLLDFLSGLNCKPNGTVSVCSVADVFLPKVETAKISKRLCLLFTEEECNDFSFKYDYYDEEQKGRFIIFASPELIEKAMKVLASEVKNDVQ